MQNSPAPRARLAPAGLLALAVCLWLTGGIYSDREFGEWHLFTKPHPSWRFFFYAPLGESDRPPVSLPPSERRAEEDYRRFVERRPGRP